jgi:hypothetical protein
MAKEDQKRKGKKSPCRCPYCDMELDGTEVEYCSFCNFKIGHCTVCSYPVTDEIKKCPNCGVKL